MRLRNESLKQAILSCLIIGWGIFVLRKFFDFAEFEHFLIGVYNIAEAGSVFIRFRLLGGYIWNFINLFLLLISSFALGAVIVKIGRISHSSFLEKGTIAVGLGLAVWSYLTFLLGLLGLLRETLFTTLLWAGFVFSIWFLVKNKICTFFYFKVRDKKEYLLNRQWVKTTLPRSGISWVSISAIGFVLMLNIICALAPEIHYDVLLYHLALPGWYKLQGKIVEYPFNFCSYFPQNMEMLYLLTLLVNNDNVAKLLHLCLGIGALLVIYNIGRTFFSQKIAVAAAASFYLIPQVVFESWAALTDLGICFYLLLHIWCLMKALENTAVSHKYLYLAAVFSGFALGIKYTSAVVVVISSLLILFVYGYRRKEWQKSFLLLMKFIVIVGLMVLPWLLRNISFTGSAFAPFVGDTQKSALGVDVRKDVFLEDCRRPKSFQPKDFLFTPWLNTLKKDSLDSFTGPLFLLFAPFLVWLAFRHRGEWKLLFVLCYFLLYFLLWRSQTSVWRYLLPALPLLCLAIAYCMYDENINWVNRSLLKILWVVILLGNAAIICMGFQRVDPVPVFLAKETKESYLGRSHIFYPSPSYPVVVYLNENTSLQSRVLFVGETRGYYCERDFIANSPFDVPTFQKYFKGAKGSRELAQNLKRDGITHILFNEQELFRLQNQYHIFDFQARDIRLLQEFWRKHSKLLFYVKGVGLYEIY